MEMEAGKEFRLENEMNKTNEQIDDLGNRIGLQILVHSVDGARASAPTGKHGEID